MTPEGKVKELIKGVLKAMQAYYHMPVQNGMGAPTLDFTGSHRGFYFSVEAKALGEPPTQRQKVTMRFMIAAGASVFLIDGPDCDDMFALKLWLATPVAGTVGPQVQRALQKDTV